MLLSSYTLAFALQLRKSIETLCQGSRVVRKYSLRRLGCLLRDRLECSTEHQFIIITRWELQSALGRHKCLLNGRTKGFPASANFESKLSVRSLMRSAKNRIPKSSWICLLATSQDALVAMLRHLDCKTCSFLTWLQAADLQIGQALSIRHRMDKLLVAYHTVSDGQSASPV
jgi:hypothetical protein